MVELKIKILQAMKTDIEKSKRKSNDISKFVSLVDKYSDFEELTPEILRAFIDKVLIHEKEKIDGYYKHTIEIIYNFVEPLKSLTSIRKEQKKRRGITPRLTLKGQSLPIIP